MTGFEKRPPQKAEIRRELMWAVVGSVAHNLNKTSHCEFVNPVTVVSRQTTETDHSSEIDIVVLEASIPIVSWRLLLNQIGTVILTLKYDKQNTFSNLGIVTSREDLHNPAIGFGSILCLAPQGWPARMLGKETPRDDHLIKSGTPPDGETHSTKLWHARRRRVRHWKSRLCGWLEKKGFARNQLEEGDWIEIELPTRGSFTSEELGKISLAKPEAASSRLMLLWPASLCFFKRSVSGHNLSDPMWPFTRPDTSDDDPLDLAFDWMTSIGNGQALASKDLDNSSPEHGQENTTDSNYLEFDMFDNLDISARNNTTFDIQNATAVYPTPPDVTLSQAHASSSIEAMITTPADAEDHLGLIDSKASESSMSRVQSEQSPLRAPKEPATSEMGIGSGNYDEDEDDDLFGDINENDFGTKGLTDADFSFFDEPELNDMDMPDLDEDTNLLDADALGSRATNILSAPAMEQSSSFDVLSSLPEAQPDLELESEFNQQDMTGEPANSHPTESQSSLILDQNRPSTRSSEEEHFRKVVTPPLSPKDVRRKLHMSKPHEGVSSDQIESRSRRGSYKPLPFVTTLDRHDSKYTSSGSFFYEEKDTKLDDQKTSGRRVAIPHIGLPPKNRKKSITRLGKGADFGDKKLLKHHSEYSSTTLIDIPDRPISDSEDESVISGEIRLAPSSRSLKRRREASLSDGGESPVSMPESPGFRKETDAVVDRLFSLSEDLSLSALSRPNETTSVDGVLSSDEGFVEVAQMFVDQVSQSTLNSHNNDTPPNDERETELASVICGAISQAFDDAIHCDLFDYATSIKDTPGQLARFADKAGINRAETESRSSDQGRGMVYRLPPPHLSVQRAKVKLEVLPPALPFWETFGFEPSSGDKDIDAFCIYPDSANIKAGATAFLKRLSEVYISCKLGVHDAGYGDDDLSSGLVSWDVSGSDGETELVMEELRNSCDSLGK